jgi:D-glycero-alpha-D-manno-heptose 1-phosphate guanylyltransferase
LFLKRALPDRFSFEKDYLEKFHHQGLLFGKTDPAYFIDIGIPEDYARAQLDLAQPSLDTGRIDRDWTLFLDRDGVINHDKVGSYIFNPGEFVFYDGARESFERLAKKFGRIIIVTNQRGVGRGLMTPQDLEAIHDKMKTGIEESGGRLDAIFFATDTDNKNSFRKPNPGMAILAKKQFPGIDFSRSVMIGNNPGDMQFGRNTGMYTVFLRTTRPEITRPDPDIDLVFDSLEEFSKTL